MKRTIGGIAPAFSEVLNRVWSSSGIIGAEIAKSSNYSEKLK